MKLERSSFMSGLSLGIASTIVLFLLSSDYKPKQVYQTRDLNSDGRADIVLQTNEGHKYPLFGVQKGNTLEYLSGEEMQKLSPNSQVDYKKIEDLLN